MSLRRRGSGAAKLIVGAFNAFTNGLTSSMPAAAARQERRHAHRRTGGDRGRDDALAHRLLGRRPPAERRASSIKKDKLVSITKKYPFLKLPVLRGSVVLIQSLILGMRALNYSASVATEGEDGEPEMSNWAVAGSMLFALVLGVGFFILAPLGITNLIRHYFAPQMGNFAYNAIDGVLRALFFFVYILSISLMDEIRRVFQYHGAEHKTVYTFEANEELTVENARKKSTLHPRCGTSFLMFVMAISILVFSLVPSTAPFAREVRRARRADPADRRPGVRDHPLLGAPPRQPGLPHPDPPGMWLQRITTKEPDDKQLEVAIIALKEALLYDAVEPEASRRRLAYALHSIVGRRTRVFPCELRAGSLSHVRRNSTRSKNATKSCSGRSLTRPSSPTSPPTATR